MKAYHDLYFEREAYLMQGDLDYRHHRRHYAWWHLRKRSSIITIRKQGKNDE